MKATNTFRKNFLAALAKRGETQAELCRRVRIIPQALSKKLRGNPTLGSLKELAQWVETPLHKLLDPKFRP